MNSARALVVAVTISILLIGVASAPAAEPVQDPGWKRYHEDMDRALDDAERELRRLEKRLDAFAAQSRARLEEKRRLVRRRLAEMRARTERAWRAARPELERALEELRKAFREPAPEPDVTRT
jgi:sugar-specific transcriptional regulator TrmB